MTYGTIIVGTDGSSTARLAEHTATLLARAFSARLLVACAYREAAADAEAVLERAIDAARGIWAQVEPRPARGSPAEALVRLAREEAAGLLVMGNKGMTGKARFLLGSATDRVSHNAPCDLLIVRTSGRASTRDDRKSDGPSPGDSPVAQPPLYRKVLLATDGSQTALAAVRRGFEFSAALGATPVLFYAGHPRTGEIVFGEVTREFLPAGMLQRASVRGDPADAITQTADRQGFDLVVLGNKGMVGRGPHIGVIPNKVSHQATTDLLIVKTVSASVAELARGQGALVTLDGRKAAVFVDEHGVEHRLSPRCTHMGCTVEWNADERSWDCPCHGSRFAASGAVIRGPAARPLARLEDEAAEDGSADGSAAGDPAAHVSAAE